MNDMDDFLINPEESEPAAAQAQRRNDMLAVLATPQGMRVMARMIVDSGVLRPVHTAEAEGARRYGLALMAEVRNADSAVYRSLMMEMINV